MNIYLRLDYMFELSYVLIIEFLQMYIPILTTQLFITKQLRAQIENNHMKQSINVYMWYGMAR